MSDFYNIAKKIDEILHQGYSDLNGEKILKLSKENHSYEEYFFNKVSDLSWFNFIKINNYFFPEKVPTPRQSKQEGYTIIPKWNVLSYLEKISNPSIIKENEKYYDELLDIIKNITRYHVKHKRKLDNYRLWFYFVKILINIPNDKVAGYLIENKIKIGYDWVKKWITSRFNNILQSNIIIDELLPKFLTENKEDIIIAQQIIDEITNIKEKYFKEKRVSTIETISDSKKPETIIDSYLLIKSLKKNVQKISEVSSVKFIFKLANKLKKIFIKENEYTLSIIESNNTIYRLRAKLIKDFLFEISIELLEYDKIKALKPSEKHFGLLKEKGVLLYRFEMVNIKDKEEFTKNITERISKEYQLNVLKNYIKLEEKILNLYDDVYSDNFCIRIQSLYADLDTGPLEGDILLAIILRDILSIKCNLNYEIGESILNKLLSEEYQFHLFRRLVLYIINTNWDKYKRFFWKFFEVVPDAFGKTSYKVELYKLLQTNIDNFSFEEKEKIESLIIVGPCDISHEKKDLYIAYWKQMWYSAMQKDSHFLKLYEEQEKITGITHIKSPDEELKVTIDTWEDKSPLSKEDILKMNNGKLAQYLSKFKTKDSLKGPTESGLAESLNAAVRENPDKFVEDLEPFLFANYHYIYKIIEGFKDNWKNKKSFNWGKLFNFIEFLLKNKYIKKIKKGKKEGHFSYRFDISDVISAIADLIHEGVLDDSWSFSEKYLSQAEKIIDILLDKIYELPKKEKKVDNEFVTKALNTPYGKTITALILLSIHNARVEDRKSIRKDIKWDSSKYDNILKNEIIEGYTLFGRYMPNFFYLNKSWTIQKIKNFESFPENSIKWQAFIEGYLLGYPQIYTDLYNLMRNHYLKAIKSDFAKEHAKERLIQHITIGYLRSNESLDNENSLFKKIINKWEYSQIKEIVHFLVSQSRHLVEKIDKKEGEEGKIFIDRIINFWRWSYENKDLIRKKLKKDYYKLLSDLSDLIIVLSKIDSETLKWIKLSAPYVGEEYTSSLFIKNLNKFNDNESVMYISEIYLKMLDAITPIFRQEDIKSIVWKIYKSNKIDVAKEICNLYGMRNHEFLRPYYNKMIKKEGNL